MVKSTITIDCKMKENVINCLTELHNHFNEDLLIAKIKMGMRIDHYLILKRISEIDFKTASDFIILRTCVIFDNVFCAGSHPCYTPDEYVILNKTNDAIFELVHSF